MNRQAQRPRNRDGRASYPKDPQTVSFLGHLDGDFEQDNFVKSNAYYSILDRLKQYGRERAAGSTILVGADRGGGKTFTVWRSIVDANRKLAPKEGGEVRPAGLLPVNFMASLFLEKYPLEVELRDEEARRVALQRWRNDIACKLIHGLYRSFIAAHASGVARLARNPDCSPLVRELAAQWGKVLDQCPDEQMIRSYFDTFGIVESGLIVRKCGNEDRNFGRGQEEMLALSTLSDLATRILQEFFDQNTRGSSGGARPSHDQDADKTPNGDKSFSKFAGRDLPALLVSAVTGIGGLGALSDMQSSLYLGVPAVAALTLGAYLITRNTVRFAQRRSGRVGHEGHLWKEEKGPETLRWGLDDIFDRLNRAGYYPVFIFDELDKLGAFDRDPGTGNGPDLRIFQIERLAKELKGLIGERTAVLYLVNQVQYRGLVSGETGYSENYSSFKSHQYIRYTSASISVFMNERIREILARDEDGSSAEDCAVPCSRNVDAWSALLRFNGRQHLLGMERAFERFSFQLEHRITRVLSCEEAKRVILQCFVEAVMENSPFPNESLDEETIRLCYDAGRFAYDRQRMAEEGGSEEALRSESSNQGWEICVSKDQVIGFLSINPWSVGEKKVELSKDITALIASKSEWPVWVAVNASRLLANSAGEISDDTFSLADYQKRAVQVAREILNQRLDSVISSWKTPFKLINVFSSILPDIQSLTDSEIDANEEGGEKGSEAKTWLDARTYLGNLLVQSVFKLDFYRWNPLLSDSLDPEDEGAELEGDLEREWKALSVPIHRAMKEGKNDSILVERVFMALYLVLKSKGKFGPSRKRKALYCLSGFLLGQGGESRECRLMRNGFGMGHVEVNPVLRRCFVVDEEKSPATVGAFPEIDGSAVTSAVEHGLLAGLAVRMAGVKESAKIGERFERKVAQ